MASIAAFQPVPGLTGDGIVVPGVLNRAATLAAGAAPKWLLRRFAGALGRQAM